MESALRQIVDRLDARLGMKAEVKVYDLYAVVTYLSPTHEPLISLGFRYVSEEWVFYNTCCSFLYS